MLGSLPAQPSGERTEEKLKSLTMERDRLRARLDTLTKKVNDMTEKLSLANARVEQMEDLENR